MVRFLQLTGFIALLAAFSPQPVQAQFNPFEALFGSPPRPPAGVPTGRQQPQYDPNDQYQRSPDQQPYPSQSQQPYPPQANVPSGYQPPPPAGYPRANVQPGQPGVQSQPLAPPTTAAIGPGAQPQALPGLPPGQRQPPGALLQPGDEVVAEPPAQKVVNKGALFSGLDKITGRIINFDVSIGETVQFGALQVTPRVCYSRPKEEEPKTDSFVEVDEITLDRKIRRIFTGWMFAESPGLNAVEHAVYDVWLKSCKQSSDVPAPKTN